MGGTGHMHVYMLCGGITDVMQEAVARSVGAATANLSQCTVSDGVLAYRETWTIDQGQVWCQSEEPAYRVGFIGSSANVASMGVTRAGGRPRFAS